MHLVDSSAPHVELAPPQSGLIDMLGSFSRAGLGLLIPLVLLLLVLAAPFILLRRCVAWIAGRRQADINAERTSEEMASFVYPLF